MAIENSVGQTWPESDAIDGWWRSHRHELAKSVSKYRTDQIQTLERQNKALREALEGWMIDHGDRCRICMERSQRAIKVSVQPGPDSDG